MSSENTIDVLNQFVAIHNRSLPVYLGYASPTWFRGDEVAREALANISEDHRETTDRISKIVVEWGGIVDLGKFPIIYSGYHDLSFDFLLGKIIEEQKQDIALMEQGVSQLETAPMAKAIAQEALGSAKGHLESLQELKQAPSA